MNETSSLSIQSPIVYSNGHWQLTVDKKMLLGLNNNGYARGNFFDFLMWLDHIDYALPKRVSPYRMTKEENDKEIDKDIQEYLDEIKKETEENLTSNFTRIFD